MGTSFSVNNLLTDIMSSKGNKMMALVIISHLIYLIKAYKTEKEKKENQKSKESYKGSYLFDKFTFYGAFHSTLGNKVVHSIFVPQLLFTAYVIVELLTTKNIAMINYLISY